MPNSHSRVPPVVTHHSDQWRLFGCRWWPWQREMLQPFFCFIILLRHKRQPASPMTSDNSRSARRKSTKHSWGISVCRKQSLLFFCFFFAYCIQLADSKFVFLFPVNQPFVFFTLLKKETSCVVCVLFYCVYFLLHFNSVQNSPWSSPDSRKCQIQVKMANEHCNQISELLYVHFSYKTNKVGFNLSECNIFSDNCQ